MLASHYGNHEEAVILARRAVDKRQRTDVLNSRAEAWLTLAEAERAAGRADEAGVGITQALFLYEQKGNVASAARLRTTALFA